MNGNYNNNSDLSDFQNINTQNNNIQPNSVNMSQFEQNVKRQSSNIQQFEKTFKNDFENYGSHTKKINIKNIFIVLSLLIVVIIIIVCLLSGGSDNDSIKVNNNQKLLECGTEIIIKNEKTKRILTSYVIENSRIVKYISSETFYLDASSDKMTDADVKNYEKEVSEECNSYPNNECELVIDYQKGKKFKYDIILTGSLLNELNKDIKELSEDEIIEKIKVKEEKNFLSCEVK